MFSYLIYFLYDIGFIYINIIQGGKVEVFPAGNLDKTKIFIFIFEAKTENSPKIMEVAKKLKPWQHSSSYVIMIFKVGTTYI